jgi:hypothetical protein
MIVVMMVVPMAMLMVVCAVVIVVMMAMLMLMAVVMMAIFHNIIGMLRMIMRVGLSLGSFCLSHVAAMLALGVEATHQSCCVRPKELVHVHLDARTRTHSSSAHKRLTTSNEHALELLIRSVPVILHKRSGASSREREAAQITERIFKAKHGCVIQQSK